MRSRIKKFPVADSYLKLIFEFPLRPIRDDAEYESAFAVMEKLVVRGENGLNQGERDYLDALDEFIAAYDRKHFSIATEHLTPLERLNFIIKESGTTRAKLQEVLHCSQPLVSLIMRGERELTKDHIRKLASHFAVSPSLFL